MIQLPKPEDTNAYRIQFFIITGVKSSNFGKRTVKSTLSYSSLISINRITVESDTKRYE